MHFSSLLVSRIVALAIIALIYLYFTRFKKRVSLMVEGQSGLVILLKIFDFILILLGIACVLWILIELEWFYQGTGN